MVFGSAFGEIIDFFSFLGELLKKKKVIIFPKTIYP